MINSINPTPMAREEILQILSNLFVQRSSFYAQIILADLQNLPSLKAALAEKVDSKLVNEPTIIVANNNAFTKQNDNDNGNGNRNYIPAKPVIDTIPQPNTVVSTTINTEEILIDLVVQKTGYPQSSITPDLKLLDDLNLDSIKAGELIAEAAKKCGVAGEIDPSSLANSSLTNIAEVINSVMPAVEIPQPVKNITFNNQIKEQNSANLNSNWVRNFSVEYVTNGR